MGRSTKYVKSSITHDNLLCTLGGLCYEDKNSSSLDEALEKADIWTSNEIEN